MRANSERKEPTGTEGVSYNSITYSYFIVAFWINHL